MSPSTHPRRTHWVKGATEEDKIWLDGPDLMSLTDPGPWADEELAQLAPRPIVDRYSKNPG